MSFNGSNAVFPGVEVYKACMNAEKTNRPIHYMGGVLNNQTLKNWEHEKRAYVFPFFNNLLSGSGSYNVTEIGDLQRLIRVRGLEKCSEIFDDKHISLIVNNFEKMTPFHKKIFIDQENERLFKHMYNKMEGDTIVAVVNQWHVPGIEAFWRHSTETEQIGEFINPIGDMDIDKMKKCDAMNELQRAIHSKNSSSEPTVSLNYQTHYHKMIVEPERSRHVFFDDSKDAHLEHGLFNDENKDVKYKKYSKDHH